MKAGWLILLLLSGACSTEVATKKQTEWELHGFTKLDSVNPILTPDSELAFSDPVSGIQVEWASRNVLNPAAVVRNDTVFLFFRAQDKSGTSRIGLATSTDGIHFSKRSEPVFYPADDAMSDYEWSYLRKEDPDCSNCFDGVEDPRIVSAPDGGYVMTYTAYDGRTARLALATSADLIHWKKEGLVLSDSINRDLWSKSGAIVVKQEGENMVAHETGGKYWMYYGDTDLFMAVSDDLIRWKPLINEENGRRITVMHPRPGYFDSRLVEPGPFALKTEEGILLIYNGSNASNANDPELPKFTYAASNCGGCPATGIIVILLPGKSFPLPVAPEVCRAIRQV